jgi:cytochrome c oxidase assembly protein subunit 15
MNKWFLRIALTASLLGLAVVVMGAYVRLSDAGLGCPDWPVCYGQLTWPSAQAEIAQANEAFPHRPVEADKAWKEQLHRFLAAALGTLVLALALLANWRRPLRRYLLIGAAAAAAAGIFAYVAGLIPLAAGLSLAAIGLPVAAAFAWQDDGRGRTAAGLLGLVIFQALLGKWTVTLLVKPIIVTAHLLGGLATVSLLCWLVLRQSRWLQGRHSPALPRQRILAAAVLAVVIAQIALGGWTSTNYAALACTDFPTCHGAWWPDADFREGFVLWRGLGVDYEFGVLDNPARVAIQLTHRLGAVIALILVLALAVALGRSSQSPATRGLALLMASLVLVQFALGVANVLLSLPLLVAVAHNGIATLLLLSLLGLNHSLYPQALAGGLQTRSAHPGRDTGKTPVLAGEYDGA